MKFNKKRIFLAILALMGEIYSVNYPDKAIIKEILLSNESKEENTPQITEIAQNQASIWNRISELILGKKLKTPDLNIKPLNRYEKLDLALNDSLALKANSSVIESHVLKELSLLTGAGSNKQEHLVNAINRTVTTFGFITLAQEIAQPVSKIDLLQKKQELYRQFINSEKASEKITQYLLDIKTGEDSFLRLFGKKNIFHYKVKDYSIEKYLESNPVLKPIGKDLDSNPTVLTNWKRAAIFNKLSGMVNPPFVGQVMTVLGITTTGLAGIKWLTETNKLAFLEKLTNFNWHWENLKNSDKNTKIKLSLLAAVLAIPYGTIYKVQLDNIFAGVDFDNQLVNKVKIEISNIGLLIKALININNFIQNYNNRDFFGHLENIDYLNKLCTKPAEISEKLNQFLDIILNNTQITDGQALAAYYLLDEVKQQIMPALKVAGQLDMTISVANLIKEFETKRVKYCFVNFVKSNKPYLKIKNGWTPLVNPDFVVATDFEINGLQNIKNIMLTGPGGCGKSTSMKELCNNIIMAQTLGIAPAEYIELAPYSKICTAIGVEEDLSKNKSKFMAQQERMNNIEKIIDYSSNNINNNLLENNFVFIAVDECYNGTTEILGAKLLYNFALKAGRSSHTTSIISTHFRVGEEVPNFSDFQVELLEPSIGKFKRTFKLLSGACDWWLHDADKAERFARWLHGMELSSGI